MHVVDKEVSTDPITVVFVCHHTVSPLIHAPHSHIHTNTVLNRHNFSFCMRDFLPLFLHWKRVCECVCSLYCSYPHHKEHNGILAKYTPYFHGVDIFSSHMYIYFEFTTTNRGIGMPELHVIRGCIYTRYIRRFYCLVLGVNFVQPNIKQ